MNYEQEYNKLFEYFLNQTQDKSTIKTSDELIEKFENNYCIEFYHDDFENYKLAQMEKEIKVLEDLTYIIETTKTQLEKLRRSVNQESRKIIDDLIKLADARKSIYCSENDEPPERSEGYIGPKILKPEHHVVYSDEYVGPEAEKIIQDNEIPDW